MEKFFVIVQGEDKSLDLQLIDQTTKDPINLTGKVMTGVLKGCPENVIIPNGSFLVTDAFLGKVTMNLTDAETLLMKDGIQSFEVILDEGDERTIVQFHNFLEVKERI